MSSSVLLAAVSAASPAAHSGLAVSEAKKECNSKYNIIENTHQKRLRLQSPRCSPLPVAPLFPVPPLACLFLSADPLYFALSAGSPAAPAAA